MVYRSVIIIIIILIIIIIGNVVISLNRHFGFVCKQVELSNSIDRTNHVRAFGLLL